MAFSCRDMGREFCRETYRLRGFNEIHEIKNGSNNGIDRIAVKRGPSGQLLDIKFVEVKTTRSASPRLNKTRYGGTQMSRKWLAANLKEMRTSGDPALKKLALRNQPLSESIRRANTISW